MKHVLWSLLVLLLLASIATACPMCKDSIPNSDAEQATGLPSGFNFSIYYMLFGLFATMGLIAMVVTKGIRSANARMTSSEANDPFRKQDSE